MHFPLCDIALTEPNTAFYQETKNRRHAIVGKVAGPCVYQFRQPDRTGRDSNP